MSMQLEGGKGKRTFSFSNFEDFYRNEKALNRAAKAAGVRSLFSFTHSLGEEGRWVDRAVDAMDEREYERLARRPDEVAERVGKWYSAEEGMRTVEALLAYLRGTDETGLESELKRFRKVLAKAVGGGQKFRLVGE